MDSETREQLVERFRAYLEEQAVAVEEGGETDLFSLFGELTALKTEVRLESRQLKTALDEFKGVFATLQANNEQLGRELEQTRAVQGERLRNALRPLLLELLELRDRLEAGLHAVQAHRPSRWRKRETARIQAVARGQEISLRRLEQLLEARQVSPLEAVGQPLDPHTMRAVEVETRTDLDSGIVIEELRKGFTWEGELLRLAEVKVNKRPEGPQPERQD